MPGPRALLRPRSFAGHQGTPFVGDALVAWRWLRPIAYDKVPEEWETSRKLRRTPLCRMATEQGCTGEHSLCERNHGLRRLQMQPFPCFLPKDVKPRFSPVPLMLIGGLGGRQDYFPPGSCSLLALCSWTTPARGRSWSPQICRKDSLTGGKSESGTSTEHKRASKLYFSCTRRGRS